MGFVSVEPGARDRLVTIQSRPSADSEVAETVSISGMPVDDWATLANVWMERVNLGGRERFAASQMSAPYDTRWRMNYRADMDPELIDVPKLRRLVYQGRTYDITAAEQMGRRDGIELSTLAR